MGMSMREIAALEREARSREDLAKAIKSDKGKEYQKQRVLYEKAAGGKKKLEEADKVLADARTEGLAIIASGKATAAALIVEAEGTIKAANTALGEKERQLNHDRAQLDALKTSLAEKSSENEAEFLALKQHETAALERSRVLDRREAAIAAREAKVAKREGEISAYDAWRAREPA